MTDISPPAPPPPPPPEPPAPPPAPAGDTVLLRIIGMGYDVEFNSGDITITRDPSEVPADQADELIAQAQAVNFILEVVPE